MKGLDEGSRGTKSAGDTSVKDTRKHLAPLWIVDRCVDVSICRMMDEPFHLSTAPNFRWKIAIESNPLGWRNSVLSTSSRNQIRIVEIKICHTPRPLFIRFIYETIGREVG